jgi:predicted GH43/DUF377 family glycosyl hydrolase
MFKWIKKGHIFKPEGIFEWSEGYAQIPRPLILNDKIRVFYATRYFDKQNLPISQTSFIDIDKKNLRKILYIHNKPSINLGPKDNFAQHGIHPTMLLNINNKVHFFYQGWKRGSDFPYETSIGLAISEDNGFNFQKTNELPVFSKSIEDPFFVNGVFIINKSNKYHMYYSSCTQWLNHHGKKESVYIIKQAESVDLLSWKRNINGCIETKTELECQNSPTIIKINEKYHMWFCFRNALDFRNSIGGYRIGYAWSDDGINWKRDDLSAGIGLGENGSWDSEMICYPYVFENEGKIIMLYCGNYFGKEGFGYAELEIE